MTQLCRPTDYVCESVRLRWLVCVCNFACSTSSLSSEARRAASLGNIFYVFSYVIE